MTPPAPARRTLLKGIGYAVFFLGVYLIGVWQFFPYPQLTRNLEAQLRGAGFSAQIQDLGPGSFPGLKARRVSIAPVNRSWEQIDLDDVEVRLPPIQWLQGDRSIEAAARLSGGRLRASYLMLNQPVVRTSWENIDLSRLRLPSPLTGLALSGSSSGKLEARYEKGKIDKAAGHLDGAFTKVNLGGGKVAGISIPAVSLGEGKAKVSAEEGKVDIQGITFEGGDLGVDFRGDILLREELLRSLINGMLSLRPNDKISQELSIVFALFPSAKASDGRYTARVRGSLDSPRLLKR